MCLALPGRVLEVTQERELLTGKVDFGGVCRMVCLEHVPETRPGDYVLVHVGFALARIDEDEAKRVFALLESMGELEQLEAGSE